MSLVQFAVTPLTTQFAPAGEDVTTYETGKPPSVFGAANDTLADPSPGTAATAVGAEGVVTQPASGLPGGEKPEGQSVHWS